MQKIKLGVLSLQITTTLLWLSFELEVSFVISPEHALIDLW